MSQLNIYYIVTSDTITNTGTRQITVKITTTGISSLDTYLQVPYSMCFSISVNADPIKATNLINQTIGDTIIGILQTMKTQTVQGMQGNIRS